LSATKWTRIVASFSLGTALSFLCVGESATLAQVANPNESQPFQSNEVDSLGGSTFGNSLNPFDLIHRNNMGPGRSANEFSSDMHKSLDDAAAEFRRLQQERWQNQQIEPAASATPEN
jgi:hypothetical protein